MHSLKNYRKKLFSLILKKWTKKQNKGQIHVFYNEKHFCVKAVFRWKQYSGDTYISFRGILVHVFQIKYIGIPNVIFLLKHFKSLSYEIYKAHLKW